MKLDHFQVNSASREKVCVVEIGDAAPCWPWKAVQGVKVSTVHDFASKPKTKQVERKYGDVSQAEA